MVRSLDEKQQVPRHTTLPLPVMQHTKASEQGVLQSGYRMS